jgi:hypothetical protein
VPFSGVVSGSLSVRIRIPARTASGTTDAGVVNVLSHRIDPLAIQIADQHTMSDQHPRHPLPSRDAPTGP